MNSWGGRITNRKMAQSLVRRLQSLSLRNCATASTSSSSSAQSTAEPEIQIPLRKERTPTDILMALEKTIKRDPNAAHYKYMDDPFLIPMTNMTKRTYALSKESGRKAAMWILQQHSDLFQHKLAEPEIPAFQPKAQYTSKDEVSEETLMSVIKQGSVTDAVTIYHLLDETSVESKQALLELLCFYNNEDALDESLQEERWYRKAAHRQRNIWRHSPEVDELFEFLKEQDKPIAAAAYNALICGTAKYLKADKAWGLYEECLQKGIPLSLMTYNYVLQLVAVLRDGPHERRSLVLDIFNQMAAAGHRPNIGTLNATLRLASMMSHHSFAKEFARSLFTDFRKLGVEPSLASYYFALITFCTDTGPRSNLLNEILDELEGKTFTMRDPYDTFFFVTAMDVARNHMNDGDVAERIHKLLLTGDNYDFIGEGFKESIYYRHYTVLMMKTRPIEEFIALYDTLVPHIYIPEPSVMEELLSTLGIAEEPIVHEFLPRLWSQFMMFDLLGRESLTTKAMELMRTYRLPENDSPVNQQFAEAAWSFFTHMNDLKELRNKETNWSPKVLADIVLICLSADKFDRCLRVISFMKKELDNLVGVADIGQLDEMYEACLERGHAQGAIDVVQLCAEWGYEEAATMGKKLYDSLPLTVIQELELTKAVGSDALKAKASSEDQ